MPGDTTIEWTQIVLPDGRQFRGRSWNPCTGCTEVSPGCDHCYARTFAERWRGIPGHPYEQGFDLRLWPERLSIPLHWRVPCGIFVNSMSDLLHHEIPDAFIRQVWDTMVQADWHIFLVLTKRPQRLARLAPSLPWPAHIWAGTTVELDQYRWRADHLRKVPAAVRFLSCEPLLGPLLTLNLDGIDWLITGGESGHGARHFHPAWASVLREECQERGISFLHKQNGGSTSKAGGRLLDGRVWHEFPTPQVRVDGNALVPR